MGALEHCWAEEVQFYWCATRSRTADRGYLIRESADGVNRLWAPGLRIDGRFIFLEYAPHLRQRRPACPAGNELGQFVPFASPLHQALRVSDDLRARGIGGCVALGRRGGPRFGVGFAGRFLRRRLC